jgi:DNA-binding response OmpR family regulator
MTGRVLVADGHPALLRAQRTSLEEVGCVVDTVDRGDQVLAAMWRRTPNVVLLSLSLPGPPDAWELCRLLQQGPVPVPVIATATQEVRDERVRALRAGADDYIALPFTGDEIHARMGALLRRLHPSVDTVRLGSTVIDFRRHVATSGHGPVSLTEREFEVLRCLAARRGNVVTREELLQVVWGYSPSLFTRTVDNCMLRLRRKLEEDPHHPTFILKVYGDGYRLHTSE